MPESSPEWLLQDFVYFLYEWVEAEGVTDDSLVNVVREWIHTRREDPYRGVSRAPTLDPDDPFENFWWARVPRTYREGRVVFCAFHIFESTRTVRCSGFTTLPV